MSQLNLVSRETNSNLRPLGTAATLAETALQVYAPYGQERQRPRMKAFLVDDADRALANDRSGVNNREAQLLFERIVVAVVM